MGPLALNAEIFWVFLRMGFLSFGGMFGALPELERMVVHERQWLTAERFVQAYVIGQIVPGPNMAMCPLVGYWVNGWGGLVAAFLGIYTAPLLVISAGYFAYRRGRGDQRVRRAERALRPVVLGLVVAACLRLWWVQLGRAAWWEQVASVGLIAAIAWLYARAKLGAIGSLFVAGGVWYAIHLGGIS